MATAALGIGCSGGGQASGEGAQAKREAEITIELAPLRGQDEMEVTVRLVGPPASATKELRVARAWADTHAADVVHSVEASDAKGPIRAGPTHDDGPDSVYPLSRPPEGGELVLRYRASGSSRAAAAKGRAAGASRLALRVGGDRASGVGHSFLLLPPVDAPIPVKIRWNLGAFGPGARGASSFGVGDEVTTIASSEDLAHAVYVAGRLQTAESGPSRRMVMLGNPELDVGAVLEWTRGVEERAHSLFREGTPAEGEPKKAKPGSPTDPFWYVLVAEPGMGREHDGAHLTRSLGLWFDEARALDARLRIAIAHELLHEFIGAGVRLEDGGKEATWFAEGFTVYYARRLLFSDKLITPDDFVADLDRSLAHDEGIEGDDARGRHEGYSRGSLYAAHLDAALRKRSGGVRSLDDIVLALLAAARREQKPRQPASLFRDLVVRELGPEGGDDFDHLIARADRPVEPPPGAFGPCFRRADRKEPVFELGFDPTSLRGDPVLIRGLVKGSRAERAGLREGDLALTTKVPDPSVALSKTGKGREVVLTISGRRGGRKIRYRPIGERTVMRWEAKRCKT